MKLVGVEEAPDELHGGLLLGVLVVHPLERRLEEAVAEAKGARGELIEYGGVALLVVAVVVPVAAEVQLIEVDGVPAEHPRQELVPGDVLLHGRDDPPALLVQRLVRPLRIQPAQLLHDLKIKKSIGSSVQSVNLLSFYDSLRRYKVSCQFSDLAWVV